MAKKHKRVEKSDLEKHIENLKGRQDSQISKIINDAWFGMPESSFIRSTPGFFVFCDLCSESYLLDEFDEDLLEEYLKNKNEK